MERNHADNRLITRIVKAGVDIVTTAPEQVYTAANIDRLGTWLPLQISNCLAREENEKKSVRLKDAWVRKRGELAHDKKLSKRGPFWLKLSADRKEWVVIPDAADRVRRMFRWAVDGLGVAKICERLHQECPGGITGRAWQPNNVRKLLRSRSVLGELQPHTGTCAKKGEIKSTRKPHGPPVVGYFPAIVTESEFYKAQQAMAGRRRGGGRVTGTPNLFNGLLYDATDGTRMVLNTDHGRRVLVLSGAIRKMPGSTFRSVNYKIFEHAILSFLQELSPADIVSRSIQPVDDQEVLAGKLAGINHSISQTQNQAATADDPSVYFGLLEQLAEQRKATLVKLEKIKAQAANPVTDALSESAALARLLQDTPETERDEIRVRIKGALRRLVDGIWLVIGCRGRVRLIECQVWFRDSDACRSSLIVYAPPAWRGQSQVGGKLYIASLKHPGDNLWPIANYDLRNCDDVDGVARVLENYPQNILDDLLKLAEPMP